MLIGAGEMAQQHRAFPLMKRTEVQFQCQCLFIQKKNEITQFTKTYIELESEMLSKTERQERQDLTNNG